MNILFVTHYYEPDSGAAANRLTRLAKQLHKRGYAITVLTTMPHYPTGIIPDTYRHKFSVTENRDGIQVIQVWLYTSPSSKISRRLISQLSFMVTCTLRGLFIKRHDVMLIENQPIFTALAGWVIGRLKRTPYLANISDFWPEYLVVSGVTTEKSLIYRIFHAIANLTQRDAAGIVALYPPLLESIKKRLGYIKQAEVIYNAVDFEKFADGDSQGFRQKYHLGDARLITFLGIMGSHIDVDTMLIVAKHFHSYENLKFVFVGTGQQKDKLRQTIESPEYDHCQWIDWIDYSEVPAFWSASYLTYWAVHDNPLDQMRFQAKLYEAMATGTPAVIAIKGLMRDILNESNAGIATEPGNPTEMIQAIEQLLDDSTAYEMISKQARNFAREHYSLKTNVDAYETMLKKISPQ